MVRLKYKCYLSILCKMSSVQYGGTHFSSVLCWNEESSTVFAFEQRVRLFVSSTKREMSAWPTSDPSLRSVVTLFDTFVVIWVRNSWGRRTDLVYCPFSEQLEWQLVPSQYRRPFRLLFDFPRLDSVRRQWACWNDETLDPSIHIDIFYVCWSTECRQKRNNNKDFLHEVIRGILLTETSELTSCEFASVLASSGRLLLRVLTSGCWKVLVESSSITVTCRQSWKIQK